MNLPNNINYLNPFFKYLKSLVPEDIEESTDLDLLYISLAKRIKNLDMKSAINRIKQDSMVLDNFILDNPDSVAAFILPFLEADKEAINYIKNYEFSMNKVISFFAMELDGFKVTKGENYLTYVDKKNMENYIGIMYVEKQYLKEYQMVEENTDTTLINLEGLEIIKYEYEIEGIG